MRYLPLASPIDGDGKTNLPLEPCSEADHSNQGARRGGSTLFRRIPGGSAHHSGIYDISSTATPNKYQSSVIDVATW